MSTRQPTRISRLWHGLTGRAWVYEDAGDVRETIAENSFDVLTDRPQAHWAGAALLNDSLAFQPGLLALHTELLDTWHHFTQLNARAQELERFSLARSLGASADAMRSVLDAVATAAEHTTRECPDRSLLSDGPEARADGD